MVVPDGTMSNLMEDSSQTSLDHLGTNNFQDWDRNENKEEIQAEIITLPVSWGM